MSPSILKAFALDLSLRVWFLVQRKAFPSPLRTALFHNKHDEGVHHALVYKNQVTLEGYIFGESAHRPILFPGVPRL